VRIAGISSSLLSRAVKNGQLERLSRGIYRHPDAPWDEHTQLAEVSARVPQAVIVLISALNFHQIGTHQAHSIWLQLKNNAVAPRIDYPPIEVVKTGIADAFTKGIEVHQLNGIAVPITTPARTVADCFKYRNRLGLELCLEALREVIGKKAKANEILEFAKMIRVDKVMLPYIEAMV
jgi:predicted transcriptional regulator of viral defense system